MAQNKGLNIALLAAVFAFSTGAGFFLSQILIKPHIPENQTNYHTQIQEPEPVEAAPDSIAYWDSVYHAELAAEAARIAEEEARAAEEAAKPEPYRYYSKSEMQSFLDHKDYEMKPEDSKYIFPQSMRIKFIGLNDNEIAPSTLAAVCDKLMMNNWERAIVETMSHNSMNQITSLTIRVQYPGQESYYEEY